MSLGIVMLDSLQVSDASGMISRSTKGKAMIDSITGLKRFVVCARYQANGKPMSVRHKDVIIANLRVNQRASSVSGLMGMSILLI